MQLLVQFLLRLSFGMCAAMAVTPPRLVTSGYYRNNSYVVLGLSVLASLMTYGTLQFWPALAVAILSYAAAVCWLYEMPRQGVIALVLTALAALIGCWGDFSGGKILSLLESASSGLVLGTTMAAMLLGHWYLNSPGMKIAPLQTLVRLMIVAIVVRAVLSAVGLGLHWADAGSPTSTQLSLLALRWLAGLVGAATAAIFSLKTLEIPNTQSATGILYVGVIGTFLGEMTAALLSAELSCPV